MDSRLRGNDTRTVRQTYALHAPCPTAYHGVIPAQAGILFSN